MYKQYNGLHNRYMTRHRHFHLSPSPPISDTRSHTTTHFRHVTSTTRSALAPTGISATSPPISNYCRLFSMTTACFHQHTGTITHF